MARDPQVQNSVIASTFADLGDLVRFKNCKAQGKTDQECFKVGDNGIGVWDDNTAQETTPMCALPPEIIEERWGPGSVKDRSARFKPVMVSYKERQCLCLLADTMPHLKNLHTSARIDLNPAAVTALHIPKGGMVRVIWHWANEVVS